MKKNTQLSPYLKRIQNLHLDLIAADDAASKQLLEAASIGDGLALYRLLLAPDVETAGAEAVQATLRARGMVNPVAMQFFAGGIPFTEEETADCMVALRYHARFDQLLSAIESVPQ